jgi:hypothetical protein
MADNATLKSQYLAQIQADLERTAKEKERIAEELAALQEQLTSLEQDHALLVGVQQALAGVPSAPEQNTEPAAIDAPEVPQAAVPRPRRTKPKTAPRTPEQATLVELVVADLTARSEPRSAAEIATALTQAHPGRKIQTTVVRNTLEALVAKGQALRSKQGRSVYYSAAVNPAASAQTAEAAA